MKALFVPLALLCATVAATIPWSPEQHQKRREFAQRLLAAYEGSNAVYADNETFVYAPHLENPPKRHKRAAIFANNCPPGYTGVQCETPICAQRVKLDPHDGTLDTGDMVEFAVSPACQSNITVYVDAYQETLYVYLYRTLQGASPRGLLYGPDGKRIAPSESQPLGSDNEYLELYNNIQNYGPGIYSYSTYSQKTANCAVQVTATSKAVVDGGFVESATDDNVQQFVAEHSHTGVERDPKVGVASYYAFKATGVDYPASVDTVEFHVGGRKLQGPPLTVRPRYKCNAPSFVGPYVCTKADIYHAKIRGMDFTGNIWQRVYEFHCDVPTPTGGGGGPPTGTPPTLPPVNECQNGGKLVPRADGGGNECFCGPFYAGLKCEVKLCLNGGTLGDQDICGCAAGYSGDHCEHVQCKAKSGENFDVSSRALAFVVRVTKNTQANLNAISRAANLITAYYEANYPGYFQKHVLVTFGNGETTFSKEYDDPAQMVLGIQNAGQYAVDSDSCSDSVLEAISDSIRTDALSRYLRSPIFVFSDALPSDDPQQLDDLFGQLSYFRGQIFSLVYHSATDTCTGAHADPHNLAYVTLQQVSRFSHGIVTLVDVNDLDDVAHAISQTLPGVDNLLSNDFLDSCSYAPKYQTLFVDESVGKLYFLATGLQLSAQLKGPDNKFIQPDQQYTKGDLLMAVFPTVIKGNYLLSVSGTQSYCQYRVFGESKYDLYVATAREVTNDVETKQPVWGKEAHIVAHFNGLAFPDPEHLYAEAQVWTNEAYNTHGRRTVLYSSSGVFRDRCDYNLYFGSWKCPRRGLPFYVNVYVTDQTGYTVMRTTTGYCAARPPKQVPPSGCQNGGADPFRNGTCVCPPDWSGAHCEKIRCRNQGTSMGSYCECPTTWTGDYCEVAKCPETDTHHSFSPLRKSLHFIVHDSSTALTGLSNLIRYAHEVIADITSQHPRWLVHYSLSRFNDTDFGPVADSRDPNDVVRGLTNIFNSAKNNPTWKSCDKLLVNEATFIALKGDPQATKGAIVYIFVKGVPIFNNPPIAIDNLMELLEQLEATVNVVQMTADPTDVCGQCACDSTKYGPKSSEWLQLISLAAMTGGSFYHVSEANTGGALQTIPTQYSNALIYENFADDCTSGQTFYFPVDSETQTLGFLSYGDFSGLPNPPYQNATPISLTDPNGVVYQPADLGNFWNDPNTLTRFDQLTKPCDPGWESDAHHCYLYVADQETWQDAQTKCHAVKASLATIFDVGGENLLQRAGGGLEFWIGLNDLASKGDWQWEVYQGPALELHDMAYRSWAPGEPSVNNGQCVKLTSTGWKVVQCSDKNYYACMKHAYELDYAPSAHSNLLPFGIWSVSLNVYNEGVPSACAVKVYAQSTIQVYNEFTIGDHDDHGWPEPIKFNVTANRIVAHTTGVDSFNQESNLGSLMYAHMYAGDKPELLQVETFHSRDTDTCNFNYISTPFQCPVASYQIAYTGIDRYGALFQRIKPALCYGGNTDGSCLNNGVFFQGQCVCPPNWYGDRCEVPNCVNGKLAASGEACECRYGYQKDPFCKIPQCIRNTNNGLPTPTPTKKTFVLVLDGSWTGANNDILTNLQSVLNTIITDTTQVATGWFNYYVAVVAYDRGFTGGQAYSDIIKETDSTTFINNVVAEVTRTNYKSAGQSRAYMSALVNALSDPGIAFGSRAFVVGASNVQDPQLAPQVLDATAPHHTTITYFVLPDTKPPGGAGDYSAQSVYAMFETAGLSGGYFYQAATRANLISLWRINLITTYTPQTVVYADRKDCSNLQEYIQVDGHSNKLIFDFFAFQRPDINLTDPDGVHFPNPAPGAKSNTNWIWNIETGVKPGLWSLAINAGESNKGGCFVNVRTATDHPVYVAFTTDVATDGGAGTNDAQEYPVEGRDRNAVVVRSDTGFLTHVQFFDRQDRSLLWASPLVRRGAKCTFNYVSQEIFTCPAPSFTVAVDGIDENGHPFRREQHVHCVGLRH